MNTLQLGAIGLSKAIHEYLKLGYMVSIPVIDASDYDLIIEKDNKLYSVQCKFTSAKNKSGNYKVGLRSIKTNTKKTVVKQRGVYDILFVMCSDGNCYSIPSSILPKNSVVIGSKYLKYKL